MDKLDEELAGATDALLSGRNMPTLSEENQQLGEVLRQLYRAIEPDAPPSPAFAARLTRMLDAEWGREHRPALRLVDRPLVRFASLAAAVVLVLGALLVLAVPDANQPLQGTAIGMSDGTAIFVLLSVAVVGTLFYWRNRRS